MASKAVQFFEVESDYEGQRLDNFLMRELKGVPRTLIYRLLRTDEIRVNKKRVKPSLRLTTGDSIRVAPIRQSSGDRPQDSKRANQYWQQLESQILFENDQLIIIDKPNGWAVHGGSGINMGVIETIRLGRPELSFLELAHRLDRETSGCLIIAKKRSTLLELHELIRRGKILKRYYALVHGYWPKSLQRIDAPLQKYQRKSGERIVHVTDEGKPSTTLAQVVKRFKAPQAGSMGDTNIGLSDFSLLDIELITGRTHQIRVHCKHSGYAVVGDEKYGNPDGKKYQKTLGLQRLFLHAYQLQFKLPNSALISVEAPLADNFTLPMNQLTAK